MTVRTILNSWKEIAQFLGRGVRTVQRWEYLYGMPVHRPAGKSRSAVLAFSDEVEKWLHDGGSKIIELRESRQQLDASLIARLKSSGEVLVERGRVLHERAEQLNALVTKAREQIAKRHSQPPH